MTLVRAVTEAVRGVLVNFIIGAALVLLFLLAVVIVQRWIRAAAAARRRRLEAHYQPLMDFALHAADGGAAIETLASAPGQHRRLVAALLLTAAKSLTGEPIDRAGTLARAMTLDAQWIADLQDGRWWRRADAARALGLVGDAASYGHLVRVLEDPHDEVRSAATDALGRLGDVRVVPALLEKLSEQSRHQRVRIVEALRGLGVAASAPVAEFARAHVDMLPVIADLLATVCGGAIVDDALKWSRDERAGIRAAAIGALGSIGLDDRSYYFALRALGDDDVAVRAMAARALGRSRRQDAAPYLASRLDDDWSVAAHCARALGAVGSAGRVALEAAAAGQGQGAALARHMLWESEARLGRASAGEAAV